MGGSSSSSSSSTETETQNLNLQGNEGVSVAGNRGEFNLDLSQTDYGTVEAAAQVTTRALDIIENVTMQNLKATEANYTAQSKENRDIATKALESSPNAQTSELIKWGVIGAIGLAVAASVGKSK
ncbi:MAG: hypothetical protein OQL08_01500 [Gammaproteobacteria bacterium]|nr:hypothetical protein [Gammaproteobacteria bacterium]